MSLKWKCIESSFLIIKHDSPNNEKTGVCNMEEDTQIQIIGEQPCSEATDPVDCDSKSAISVGELYGYSVSNETYYRMPSTLLLPPDAEQKEQCIKQEQLENTEYGRAKDTCDCVKVKCETMDHTNFYDISIERKLPNTCLKCKKSFDNLSNLKEHMVELHADMKALSCSLCGKTLLSEIALDIHMEVHTDLYSYRCTKCDKYFKSLSILKRHTVSHTGKKPHSCSVCEKSFKSLLGVKRHMLLHTGEKTHSCKVCDKSFVTSTYLKLHMLIHTGEKPHRCTICNESFHRLSTMKRHVMNHTGEKPQICTICDKAFKFLAELKRHMLVHTGKKSTQVCSM